MKCVVVGLGHVGGVIVADLLRAGHSVLGVDRNPETLACYAGGTVPFREKDIGGFIAEGRAEDRLSVAERLGSLDDVAVVFICVSTRGSDDGALDTGDVVAVAREIGASLRNCRRQTAVHLIFCSTFNPGTMDAIVVPEIERVSGLPPGATWEASYWPETSHEGSALADRLAPSRVVVGERTPGSGTVLREWLRDCQAPVFFTSFEMAELTKVADNTFHALKVSFANELGRLCAVSGLPADELLRIFCADTRLNVSAAYLKAGFSYGGPCLPKDVRALAAHMVERGVDAPVIRHIDASNERHMRFALDRVCEGLSPGARVLLFGLSFKPGVDDLRGSPFVRLAKDLMAQGYDVTIVDPDLETSFASRAPAEMSDVVSRVSPEVDVTVSWDKVIVAKYRDRVPEQLGSIPRLYLDQM